MHNIQPYRETDYKPIIYIMFIQHIICIVCNSVKCTNTFNILAILYNGHIALNYTGHFVEVQPYQKTDYKPIIYICILYIVH